MPENCFQKKNLYKSTTENNEQKEREKSISGIHKYLALTSFLTETILYKFTSLQVLKFTNYSKEYLLNT